MSSGENNIGLGSSATKLQRLTIRPTVAIFAVYFALDVSVVTKMDNLRKFWIVKKDNMLLIEVFSADQQGMLRLQSRGC